MLKQQTKNAIIFVRAQFSSSQKTVRWWKRCNVALTACTNSSFGLGVNTDPYRLTPKKTSQFPEPEYYEC